MTKKRAGVQAGMNLVALDDEVLAWETVEHHYDDVTRSIPNLLERERALEHMPSLEEFSKEHLDQIVSWKHTVGKNRVYNIKLVNANADHLVKKHSRAAINMAQSIRLEDCVDQDGSLSPTGRTAIQSAIGELTQLRGVGPATASAILTLVRPDVFCYMYDEVIDCFLPQRDYKIGNYLDVNSRCLQLAQKLGAGWNTSRVARTIWTAARFLAIHGRDLTVKDTHTVTKRSLSKKETCEDQKPPSKRLKA
jgi:hypothetical protein